MSGTLALVGLVVFVASVPLAAQRVGPNRWYGFRTPRVIADERVWYPVNRMTGRNGIVFAIVLWTLALTGGLGLLGPTLVSSLLSVVLFGGLISTFVSASRIVAEVDAGGPRLDTRSSFDKTRQYDAEKARKKLFEKL